MTTEAEMNERPCADDEMCAERADVLYLRVRRMIVVGDDRCWGWFLK